MDSIRCARCGLLNAASAEICTACGAELSGPVLSGSGGGDGGARSGESGYGRAGGWGAAAGASLGEMASSPAIGPFTSIGAVITPTIDLFKDNFWLITKIVIVVFAPYEIFKAWETRVPRADWQTAVGIFLLDLVCRALVAPALIYALVTVMRGGKSPAVSEAYRWALGRLGRIMLCATLAWLITMLGMIALIVPGLILSLAFAIVYPMAALEDRRPMKILERSYNLTKGYRIRIFLASLVIGLLSAVIAMPAGAVIVMLAAGGVSFWPLTALISLIADVAYQLSTVLSLVIYLSLVRYAPQETLDVGSAEARSAF